MEIPISEKLHYKRLEEKGIVIEDIFLKETSNKKELLVRATDGLRTDTIINKPRAEKRYFIGKECIYSENDYDKTMLYTFILGKNSDENITCSNCGNSAKEKDFFNGCPYCGTCYNFDYNTKSYFKDNVYDLLNSKAIKNIIIVIYLIVIIIEKIYIENILYFLFMVMFALPFVLMVSNVIGIIYLLIKEEYMSREKSNCWRNLENARINKGRLYSSLISGLVNYYYDEKIAPKYKNLIDFDILNYKNFEISTIKNELFVIATYKIRKVYFENGNIRKTETISKVKLKRNLTNTSLKDGYNIIKCANCGASIDITDKECKYCHTKIDSKNEWAIEEFIKDEM